MVRQYSLVASDDFRANELGDGDDVVVVDLGGRVNKVLGDAMHDFLSEGEGLNAFKGSVVYSVEVGGGDAEGAEEGVGGLDEGGDPVHAHGSSAECAGACKIPIH